MKRNTIILLIALAVLAATAVWIPSPTGTPVLAALQPSAGTNPPAISAMPQFGTIADLETTLENIYDEVSPSVVAIHVVSSASTTTPRTPGLPDSHPTVPGAQSEGSGFIWDTQGHIVTNNHVVDGASRISVTFADGTTAQATLVGADPHSDLAVIKVDPSNRQVVPVRVGDSKQVRVGQVAIAIGNPFGEENTMTTGIISALGRSLPVRDGVAPGPTYSIPDVIQTDAPINPGNSGGVLLNVQGQVIGVTAAIESPVRASSGIGFAIPSGIVQKVVPALIRSGRYEHPYIGISGTTLTPNLAQAMGLTPDQRGALVVTVTANGPAEKAGVRASTQTASIEGVQTRVGGDVITAIDGQIIRTFEDLVAYLANSTQVNQTVTLTIIRDGKTQTIQVTLAARPR